MLKVVAFLRSLLTANAILEGGSGLSTILTAMSTIITSLLQALSSFTAWVLADDLAVMFFAIMFIMLAIHLLHSLVHKFS